MATELVRYELSEGGSILVEVGGDDAYGYEQCAREAGGVVKAGRTLESAFRLIVPSARAILDSVEDLKASEVGVEFGIKLAGEAGVIVAKSSAEGHFNVRMTFYREYREAEADE